MVTVEGSRLEGVILRSQLLVLLQRRHFCDQHGRPVGREYSEKHEIELEVRQRQVAAGGCLDESPTVAGCSAHLILSPRQPATYQCVLSWCAVQHQQHA